MPLLECPIAARPRRDDCGADQIAWRPSASVQVMNLATPEPPNPVRAAPPSLVWKHAAADLYAATIDGEFAGYIAAFKDTHQAFGPHAQHLGSHRSFRAASAALDRWWTLADGSRASPGLSRPALSANAGERPTATSAAS